MGIELKVPDVGESIQEVQIGQWLKKEGDWVEKDEEVVELETEKASVQVPSPEAGKVTRIMKKAGEFAEVGEVIAEIAAGAQPAASQPAASQPAVAATSQTQAPSRSAEPAGKPVVTGQVMPAAERLLAENGLRAEEVKATGPGGRLLKEDVIRHLEHARQAPPAAAPTSAPAPRAPQPAPTAEPQAGDRREEVVPMSMIRRTIASRLVEAQQNAALLTTFNEIDMQPIMELRKKYRDAFEQKHGVKLGFMSFFAKAAVEGLRRYPAVNAEIRETNIVYHNYYDIGIAIGGGKGLVVPVLRNVERMSFAEIERTIGEYADRAKSNQLKPQELEGGTFTISNGGIYGSLLSTPIVNPPQSGILGLHAIQERPIARDGQVVVRPMMYIALTYDHRIIDGREAVSFLKTIKEVLEDPARLFLEV